MSVITRANLHPTLFFDQNIHFTCSCDQVVLDASSPSDKLITCSNLFASATFLAFRRLRHHVDLYQTSSHGAAFLLPVCLGLANAQARRASLTRVRISKCRVLHKLVRTTTPPVCHQRFWFNET